MAQDSWPWECTPAVGDAGAITLNDLVNANQFIGNTQPNSEGVIYWESASPFLQYATPLNGLLAPSRVSNVVTIANGVGMVQGWIFTNTANVDFDFAADPGNANATDLIVMERGDPAAAQTVRLARVKGAVSSVATVTQSAAVWQIPLAQVPLSAGGLPTGLADVRRFVGFPLVFRQGGSASNWATAGTTNYPATPVTFYSGVVNVTVTAGQTAGFTTVTLPRSVHDDKMIIHTAIPIEDSISIPTVAQYTSYGGQSTFGTDLILVTVKRMDNTTLGGNVTIAVRWSCWAGQ